jgi:hypothetical protein
MIDPAKTIDVALKLEPGTLHLFVAGGTAAFDTRAQAILRESSHHTRADSTSRI